MQKIIVTIVGLVLVGSVTYGNYLPPTPEYSIECNNSLPPTLEDSIECNNSLPPTLEYPVNYGRVYNSNK